MDRNFRSRGDCRKPGGFERYIKPKVPAESSTSTLSHTCNYKDTTNYNPLFLAVHNGKLKVTRSMLKEGSLEEEVSGRKLIHIAAARGHEGVIRLLCKRNAQINEGDKDGNSPLHLAIKGKYTDVVNLLLNEVTANLKNLREATPLHVATEMDNLLFIDLLLKSGAKVDEQDKDGKTPLHISAEKSNPKMEIIMILLNHGASVYRSCKKGFTPLHFAAQTGNEEIVKLLVTEGDADKINARGKNMYRPLHFSAANGHIQVSKYLIDCGAEIDSQTTEGNYTPLHLAAMCGHRKVVEELIKAGADINSSTKFFETPLHLAAASGRSSIVKYLLDSGAAIRTTCRNYTPLHYALDREKHDAVINHNKFPISFSNEVMVTPFWFEKYLQITEMLLIKGASVTSRTLEGDSPLDYALKIRVSGDDRSKHSSNSLGKVNLSERRKKNGEFRPEIVRCLLNYGAEMSFFPGCSSEDSSLTKAINLKCLSLVDILLEYDINDSFDYSGALYLAQKKGDLSIILAVAEKISDIETIVDLLYGLDNFYYMFMKRLSTRSEWLHSEAISKLLIAIIVKMRSTSKIANVIQSRELEYLEREWLTEWHTHCDLEVMNMRERKMHHQYDITFYDILTSSVSKMASYARNENLMRILDADTCKQFAAFAPCLERSIAKGKERKDLIEYSTECFFTLVRQHCKIQLPSLTVDKIFEYLSVTDLRKLSSTIRIKSYHYDRSSYEFHAVKRK